LYISVNDGVVIFATHFIKCNPEGARDNLAPFQLEKDGVVIYSEEEKNKAESKLMELGISYAIEPLDYEQHKPKSQGIKYASRTEAIEHLLNDAEPESQVVPNLKKRLVDSEAKHKEKDDKIKSLEERLIKIEQKLTPV